MTPWIIFLLTVLAILWLGKLQSPWLQRFFDWVPSILLAYLPTIRQVDQLVVAVLDTKELGNPEVAEILVRPWVADRIRLRPAQRIVGHTGFLVRARRRGVMLPGADDPEPANEDQDS
jgi:hypothetical protein